MKTTVKQLAAGTFLALILMVSNVHAEGKEATKASSLENIETTIKLENWMINESIWNIATSDVIEVASEESLKLENWMTNDETWNNIQNVNTTASFESSLDLENWMTDTLVWNR